MRMLLSNRIASRPGWKTDRIERLIALARAIVAFERIWPRLWPASGLAGLWLAAGLYGAFAFVPGWLHLFLLLALAVAIAELSAAAWQDFTWPAWQDGARRLERASALAHRPITERSDTLAAGRGNAYAEALWRAHVRNALARMDRVRLGLAHPDLGARDRRGLRFLVLALLAGGVLVAGRHWPVRLAAAFTPRFSAGTAASLDAWITPPPYTGDAPIYLTAQMKHVRVPVGSQLVLRVHGALVPPRMALDRGHPPIFSRAPSGGRHEFTAAARLTKSKDVAVIADGHTLARWQIGVVADQPPLVAFAAPPTSTARDSTKFAVTAGDDYGIAKLSVTLTPVQGVRKRALVLDLPVDNPHAKTLHETVYEDLTASRFAGVKVRAVLTATDAAGHSGHSAPEVFTLPQRIFTSPLARALVEQRRKLVLGDLAALPGVMRTLNALTLAPQYFFADRLPAYLAIRSAYHGLRNVRDRKDITRVEDLLWQTALALDQNGATLLAQQLRRLQALLGQALASGAPQDQIERLMHRYQSVLNQYLAMLAQKAPQAGSAPVPPNSRVITGQELQDMMKAIEQLSQVGARDKAAQMLALLQNLIENMHMQAAQGPAGQGQSAQDKAAGEAIKKLGDLTGRQRELLDKTYRQSQDEGSPADGGAQGLARQQGKLQDMLGQVLKGLHDGGSTIPQELKGAGQAMGEAKGQLRGRQFDTATEAQKKALEDLQKGIAILAQHMQSGRVGQHAGSQDPFGRPEAGRGAISGEHLKLPDKSALQRARQILQELRKRAGERGRPQEELDYIDRLLKEFD